jgi:hypothetical protein
MIYATNGGREPRVPVRELMQKNLAVYSMSLAGVPHPDRRRAQSDIAAWTTSPGRILAVAARFPLYETAGGFRRRSHRRGLAATSEVFVIGAKGGLDLEVMSLI